MLYTGNTSRKTRGHGTRKPARPGGGRLCGGGVVCLVQCSLKVNLANISSLVRIQGDSEGIGRAVARHKLGGGAADRREGLGASSFKSREAVPARRTQKRRARAGTKPRGICRGRAFVGCPRGARNGQGRGPGRAAPRGRRESPLGREAERLPPCRRGRRGKRGFGCPCAGQGPRSRSPAPLPERAKFAKLLFAVHCPPPQCGDPTGGGKKAMFGKLAI